MEVFLTLYCFKKLIFQLKIKSFLKIHLGVSLSPVSYNERVEKKRYITVKKDSDFTVPSRNVTSQVIKLALAGII
jgi:hypothetical protein